MSSDYGDFCREQRKGKQGLRRHFHECPNCAIAYGTGTKVEPGYKCRNCDWVAPSKSALTSKAWRANR